MEAIWAKENAFADNVLDRLIEFYAEDAVSYPSGFPALEGRAAIESDLRAVFDEFTVQENDFKLVDYVTTGDTAVRGGEWTTT